MRVMRAMVGVCGVLACAGAVCAQEAGKAVPAKFQHVRMPGDWDHGDVVARVQRALEDAGAEGMGVVFDVGGNRARTDVVNALCGVLRETKVYTVVFLADGADKRVGVGQLLTGLCADRVAMDPETSVVGRGDDGSFREWMAEEPVWEVVEGELKERLAAQLERVTTSRTVAEEIAGAMMSPPEVFAIGKAGDRCTVMEPGASGAVVLAGVPKGAKAGSREPVVQASARALAPLGVVSAGSIRNTLAKTGGALATAKKAVNIEDTVESLTVRLERLFADAETIERDVDERLDLPEPSLKTVAKNTYVAAAQDGRHNLLNVSRMIGEIESIVGRAPEILRTPVPGQIGRAHV